VVQLYLTHSAVSGAPVRALKSFTRIHLAPAETRAVTFRLHDRDLSLVDDSGKHRIAAGKVSVWVGAG
jgi:beta-glucosidase